METYDDIWIIYDLRRNIPEYDRIFWELGNFTIKHGDLINRNGGIIVLQCERSGFGNFHNLKTFQFDGAKFLLKSR